MSDTFPATLEFEATKYHPSYAALYEKLSRYQAIYGGGDAAKALLQQFFKELDDQYKDRQKVTAFPKLCSRVFAVYAGHLFSEKPERDLPDTLKGYVKDIDGDGTDIDALLSEQYTSIALPCGLVYFLVTKQSADDDVETLHQEKASGLRPLVVPFSPLDLLKWDIDDKGNLKYIVLQDARTESAGFDQEHNSYDLLRIWTPDEWAIYKRESEEDTSSKAAKSKDWILDATDRHGLGEVPLVACHNIRKGKFLANTEMEELGLADLNIDIYNKLSWLDQGLKYQGFPVSVLQKMLDDDDNVEDIPVGPGIIVKLNPNPDEKFYIVETSGQALTVLNDVIEKRYRQFLDTAFMQINPSVGSAQKEAAEAKKLDFAQLAAALKDKAHNIDESERNIWRLMSKWQGGELEGDALDKTVKRSFDLEPETVKAQLSELIEMFEADLLGKKATLEQARTHGYLSSDFDIDAEIARQDLALGGVGDEYDEEKQSA